MVQLLPMFKGMFPKFMFTTFVIVALSSYFMVEGMPLSTQLSFFANATVNFINESMETIVNFLRELAISIGF